MRTFVAVALLASIAVAYGQNDFQRCGINEDCLCKFDCDPVLEREGALTSCDGAEPGFKCCCPNVQCGFWGDCNCRPGFDLQSACNADEREDVIFGCSVQNSVCCCRNNPAGHFLNKIMN